MDLRSRAKIAVRGISRRAGVDLIRALDDESLLKRRLHLLKQHRVDLLLDIGACAGQYAMTMRGLGFSERIVSYEPVTESYEMLARFAARDPGWTAVQSAVGEDPGFATMHVASNAQASSFLAMLPLHLQAAPNARYVRDEEVRVSTLAAVLEEQARPSDRPFLKLDTQGTEMSVLASASEQLDRVVGLQIELSTVRLYAGQPLIEDVVAQVRGLGFTPMGFEPDYWDESTGRLLQLDGIFFRE